jgi:serine protease Do
MRATSLRKFKMAAGACAISGALLVGAAPVLPALAADGQAVAPYPPSFADLVEKVSPAVVTVSVAKEVPAASQEFPLPPGPLGEMLRRFGTPNGGEDGDAPTQKAHAMGSGFIIDSAGYIVTNRHVIEDADEVQVTLQDGKQLNAKVIGDDEKTDLALLKVDAKGTLPHLDFGDSDRMRVGDWVVAVGNPFGLGGTVTAGIVSARGRDIHSGPYDEFLQIDAPINRGNSGGPTFNLAGEVIGINTAIYSPNGGSVGIGFAIPSNLAKPVLAALKQSGKVDRGWLGVSLQPITPEIAEGLGLNDGKGALVAAVTPDSPAAKSGLRSGDVVLNCNGAKVATARDLARAVALIAPGKPADLSVWRSGEVRKIAVTVGDSAKSQVADAGPAKGTDVHGLSLVSLDDGWRHRLNLDPTVQGVVVLKAPNSSEELQAGDVIQTVDNEPVTKPSDVAAKLDRAKSSGRKSALLLVNRGGQAGFVPLPLKA